MRDALAAPFPDEAIGLKPVISCRACKHRECAEHTTEFCETCGQTITTAHDHHRFVGHAYVTERLFQVDPEWDWEPMALDPNGLPLFDDYGGLWIVLTVGDVRRKGYGHADGHKGGDATLITIGHAIRIAAMRGFRVALGLWKPEQPQSAQTPADDGAALDEAVRMANRLRKEIQKLGHRRKKNFIAVLREFDAWANGKAEWATADAATLRVFKTHLEKA
ncbi:hypothetical protein [Amycolatopsis kentuckyensis]|uniref:hypothetical protein n=1 Tax=Amycolatopsis kentuckyensis TaxID=218823 RepID=UPI00356AE1CF